MPRPRLSDEGLDEKRLAERMRSRAYGERRRMAQYCFLRDSERQYCEMASRPESIALFPHKGSELWKEKETYDDA